MIVCPKKTFVSSVLCPNIRAQSQLFFLGWGPEVILSVSTVLPHHRLRRREEVCLLQWINLARHPVNWNFIRADILHRNLVLHFEVISIYYGSIIWITLLYNNSISQSYFYLEFSINFCTGRILPFFPVPHHVSITSVETLPYISIAA